MPSKVGAEYGVREGSLSKTIFLLGGLQATRRLSALRLDNRQAARTRDAARYPHATVLLQPLTVMAWSPAFNS